MTNKDATPTSNPRPTPPSDSEGSKNSSDPRVVRTRAQLSESLFKLIQHRRWEKIRVQDILNDTGISRSAFYAHYDNKFDLLTANIPEIALPVNADDEIDLLPLFEHVNDVSSILRPLLTQPILGEIGDIFHRNLATSWSRYLQRKGSTNHCILAELLAGALYAALKQYLVDKNRRSSTDVSSEVSMYLLAMIGENRAGHRANTPSVVR